MKTKSYIFAGIIAVITMGNAMATGENTVTSKSYVDARDELKQNKIPVTGTNASTPGDTVVTYTDTAGTIGERGIFNLETDWDWENHDFVSGHEGDLVPAESIIPNITALYGGQSNTVVVRNFRGAPVASRDIYDGTNTYSANDNADDLITAGAVQGQINNSITNVNNSITNITNQMNAETRESVDVPSLTCANQGCTLYTVNTAAAIAHKLYSCTAQTVASCPSCGTGTVKACENNICTCNACKGYDVSVSSASECCSGVLQNTGSGAGSRCGTQNMADCTAWAALNGVTCSGNKQLGNNYNTCGCYGDK